MEQECILLLPGFQQGTTEKVGVTLCNHLYVEIGRAARRKKLLGRPSDVSFKATESFVKILLDTEFFQ